MSRSALMRFVKDWMLVIAIVSGASAYLLYHAVPVLHPAGPALEWIAVHVQPLLLFLMLFLAFCRIEPHQLRPHRWQAWLLLVQCLAFVLLALALAFIPGIPHRVGVEAFMLCMICPTATACSVVTGKLGGDMAGVVTYTVIINLAAAVLIPLMVPLVHPAEGGTFFTAFCGIIAKVFPLLILPCMLAWLVRYLFPGLHARLVSYPDLPFTIWSFALALAILMSTRAIVHNEGSLSVVVDIAVASLISCVLQFWLGRRIGHRYGQGISAGQALGQKNTVFSIWMGYTFLDPITSVAGGFYSIWHNIYNTWQLYRSAHRKG